MHAAAAVDGLEPQVVQSAAAADVELPPDPHVVHAAAEDAAEGAAEEAAGVAAAPALFAGVVAAATLADAEEPAAAARAGFGMLETTCARTDAAKSARETANVDFIVQTSG